MILFMHLDGIPKFTEPALYRCLICLLTKSTKQAVRTETLHNIYKDTSKHLKVSMHTPQPQTEPAERDDINPPPSSAACKPGTQFHMDMGFVRGTKYNIQDKDDHIKIYNSYLILVDRATCYT